ncbi:T9SS type A sorting domain-containing protein [Algoriphagus litoralis]|uniref:T9SS type A sorting domain-containing protein n=1 Tax=Algoriphagus litoralis TaxID=2202829 RepID=UPI0013006E68|nr:T9SS type A sorting domain-containing protein [Algoriphagus litoralis]
MSARLKGFWVLIFLGLWSWAGEAQGQTYTSNQDGNWNSVSIWTRTNPNSCGVPLRNSPPNTNDYARPCQVDAIINHSVLFNSPTASFGGGYFRFLTVNGPTGNLTFQGDVVFNTSGSSLPAPNNVVFNVINGGQLNVPNGTLTLDRGGVINISGNSIITVRNLVIGANSPIVNVEAGSRLIVENTTRLESNATLNINGDFETRDLTLSSGGTVNFYGTSRTSIIGNLDIQNGVVNSRENSEIFVNGNLSQSGGGNYVGSNFSRIQILGIHNVQSNNPLSLSGSSKFLVFGNTTTWSTGPLVTQSACYRSSSRTSGTGCATCFENYYTTGTFYVPAGVSSITVEIWGGGGGGASRSTNGRGGGGGGGAYTRSIISVSEGETIYINVGVGGAPNSSGGDSWIARTTNVADAIILAKGGNGGQTNTQNGGNGGLSTNGIGAILYSGGNGSTRTSGSNGGGGGASAGTSNSATNLGNTNLGGTAPLGGGNGGSGAVNNSTAGITGVSPGGGGGGGFRSANIGGIGGSGGNGQVTISFTCPTIDPCSRTVEFGTNDGYTVIEYFCSGTWNPPAGLQEYEVLLVGGGGAGGRTTTSNSNTLVKTGGGGGAGGIVWEFFSVPGSGIPSGASYPVIVGTGGFGNNDTQRDGENSTFSNGIVTIVAGGGGGGGTSDSRIGRDGITSSSSSILSINGSGGGAGTNSGDANTGGTGEFVGGNSTSGGATNNNHGGGGGGSTSNGENASNGNGPAGNGGDGYSNLFTGFRRFYAAGGGGGTARNSNSAAIGGSAIGGNGSNRSIAPQNGATNTGSGGGGAAGNNQNGGNGGSGIVIIRYKNFRILPVEFLYFKADYNSFMRSGDLSWATAKEWENDRFEIERSVNDVKSWETVGQVSGSGYSDQPVEYAYRDMKLPLAGGNIFYRLKQFDFSGEFSYSDTKAIQVDPLAGTTYWRIYPNPTTGDPINLELLDNRGFRDENITVRIVSITGQYDIIESSSPSQLSTLLSDILRSKRAGIYTIEISWGIQREYHKVILRR